MVCKYNKNMSAFDKSMKSALFSFLPRGNETSDTFTSETFTSETEVTNSDFVCG